MPLNRRELPGRPPKPARLPVLTDNIPERLKRNRRWVLWCWEWVQKSKKWDKPPRMIKDESASTTDPATWATYTQAILAYEQGWADGIGYVFSRPTAKYPDLPADEECGVDLDRCRNAETGEVTSWAKEFIGQLDSYAEVSPSRTGVKVFLIGDKPGERCSRAYQGGKVEFYQTKRFFTVTGCRLDEAPDGVNERQAALESVYSEVFGDDEDKPVDPPPPAQPLDLADEELIRRGMAFRKGGEKFRRLWEGSTAGYPSQSEADSALVFKLYWLTNRDRARTERLFGQSSLGQRGKWRDRPDYRKLTLDGAEEEVRGGYEPRVRRRGRPPPPLPNVQTPESDPDGAMDGVSIILAYFRQRYRPDFRLGNSIHCEDGREVPMAEACAVPTSALIERLATATDAPQFKGGGVNRNALPGFFGKWSRVAWGDLLESLPEEDDAKLSAGSTAREEFRRLVRDAMLSLIVLGETISAKDGSQTQTERRSLIGWCQRFAKAGPWRDVRSYRCWCKLQEDARGEVFLTVAIRHELFAQLKADRRLCQMGPKQFTRRAARYGVGTSTRDGRPHGLSAIVLDPKLVAELVATLPDNGGEPQEG